jgi:hypothetical protein
MEFLVYPYSCMCLILVMDKVDGRVAEKYYAALAQITAGRDSLHPAENSSSCFDAQLFHSSQTLLLMVIQIIL